MAGEKSLPAKFGFYGRGAFTGGVMNTIIHFSLGLFASLMSAVGFESLANRIDMFVSGAQGPQVGVDVASAIPCADPCGIAFQNNA